MLQLQDAAARSANTARYTYNWSQRRQNATATHRYIRNTYGYRTATSLSSIPNSVPCLQPTFSRRMSGHCLGNFTAENFSVFPPVIIKAVPRTTPCFCFPASSYSSVGLHNSYTTLTLQLHYRYTVTLQLHHSYIAVTLELHNNYAVVTLQLHRSYTTITL